MEKFVKLSSTAVPLKTENIDTDQIIPARFLKATSKLGFGENLFRDWRFDKNNQPITEFPLNDKKFSGQILVAGDNFGCGSSREHAAWALTDYGFKVVISSIVRGTIFSFPFIVSLAGNSIFLLLTIPFYKIFRTKISLISISIIGAFSHNIGQLLAALLFIPLQTIQFIAIILLPIGLVTGVITGVLSNSIYNNHLEKFIETLRNKK